MVRLTCLLRRKPGMTPVEFHDHWRDVHGPLIATTRSGSYVLRYEQHPRPLADYTGDDDPGYDGITVQWFESLEAYQASVAEPDFAVIWDDVSKFLDVDSLVPVVTEAPRLVFDKLGLPAPEA
ncbi:MAG TPA: EthD domain-containing protein [Acidimicrobiales bacterium]|nr:EthD domain-containing protein [Acidimicrobiales bacterium]